MELFLVLVVGVVYAPLLLLLWVARKSASSDSARMDETLRTAFGGAMNSIKVASLNIRYAPPNQDDTLPRNRVQEHPWVYRRWVPAILTALSLLC